MYTNRQIGVVGLIGLLFILASPFCAMATTLSGLLAFAIGCLFVALAVGMNGKSSRG